MRGSSGIAAVVISSALAFGCSSSGSHAAATNVQVAKVQAQVSTIGASSFASIPIARPEALPALPTGNTVYVHLVLLDRDVLIADGMHYRAWTFNGTVPGPVIHARVGDTIDVTLANRAAIGHSIDFHAALAPPNVAYQTIGPGKQLHFSWVAAYPGVFMYHCGTPPVLAHISNGMYGAIIVDPQEGWGPEAQTFVLVQSEFYPTLYPGSHNDYYGNLAKMRTGMADVVTFNGMAFRYRDNPLSITVGKPVRIFLVDAGPSHFSAFHVVGTILSRVLVDGNPANALEGVQTTAIPPGGGAVVEFTVPQAGNYPFVTHAFGDADEGALGTFVASD